MPLFSIFYYLLALLLYVVAAPFLLLLSLKSKYKESIPARFFLRNSPKFSQSGIWFHVCSLGEAKAISPIIEKLNESSSSTCKDINITAVTHTGYSEARKYDADVRYLPYEIFLPFWTIHNRALVVMEAEFWYLLFLSAFRRGSKVILLNARINDKSVEKYMKMAWFYKRIFAFVDIAFVQSQVDLERFKKLGVKNIEVIGNIKLSQKISTTKTYEKPAKETLVAASTHEDEERLILDAYFESGLYKSKKLFIVPRHPERFSEVNELIKRYQERYSFTFSTFSQSQKFEDDIILIDKMGELNNIYAISDIVILAGAFAKIGGHNPLEPAHFGCKIISGKEYFNQKELYKYIENIKVVDNSNLRDIFENLESLKVCSIDEKIDLTQVVNYLKSIG